jgi:hypothetical protein
MYDVCCAHTLALHGEIDPTEGACTYYSSSKVGNESMLLDLTKPTES